MLSMLFILSIKSMQSISRNEPMNSAPTHLAGDPEIYRRSFLDSSDAIVITDAQGRIVDANPAWQALYGYSLDEVRGQTTRVVKSESTDREMYEHMWRSISDPAKGFWKGEIVNRRKDGGEVAAFLTITPIRRGGAIVGYMGVGIDITERKEAERLKEMYDIIVRHDLKAPLGSIITVLSTLLGGYLGDIPERQRSLLEKMSRQARNMQEIIATSLDVEKLKRGKLNMDTEDVDLSGVARESIETLGGMAESKAVALALRAPDEPVVRSVDPVHLKRCTDNLVKNAVEAAPKGDEVTATVEEHGGEARIRVRNNGEPIPPDVRPYLFHPYGTYGKRGGSGLGLYGVKLTVEAMGGGVACHTGPEGTEFAISFPAGAGPKKRSS